MNMKKDARTIGRLFKFLGSAPRIRILLAIDSGEACVCHLEAGLGLRQAYISQHLMALRKAGALVSRREGRFIYYRLRDPRLLELVEAAAQLTGVEFAPIRLPDDCACPACSPAPAFKAIENEP